jgi:hypothetical protein
MNDRTKVVLLVGHCAPDAWALASAVKSVLTNVDVRLIEDDESLRDSIADADLLLVNRVLEGGFDREAGIELIRELAAQSAGPSTMLISNYADAQADALAAGARPGFGKRQMYDPAARDRILQAVGA